ncbi:Clp protease N-terminal domain-containing protein [Streptomyces sp. TS71-3]|uniref:Clp protease N-terminal domain-containing protein n=1 Tax=Streptomyces sp. TS71-3 TaxID=2733862 RepID=UPI001B0DF39B|nr:Clp protease N-terminal domain-containing protein [Streptomyces sp. TS71-3]GHJ35912.1 peptidase [Streptomyces sp. TS71-3]
MFERFTKDARAVVSDAVGLAERAGAPVVDTDHLLLALLDREGSRASFALGALGARDRRKSIEQSLAAARRRGGLSAADADALAGLGIDLSAIVSRVEEAHGVGALAPAAGGGRNRGRLRHRPLTDGAKRTLERSLRIATGHRDRHIGDEHLLLALLARPGIPAEVLAEHDVTYAQVDRVLYGEDASGTR